MRRHLAELVRDLVDALHAIVHKVHLPAALQLLLDRRAEQLLVPRRHHGLNRHAVFGRRLDHAHVAQPQQRHVQGARNGRGRHGEHVHLFAKLLQPLLVADAEALFFVHDDQPEIAELYVLRQHAMRADDDVHLARFDLGDGFLLLLGGAEAAEHLDLDGKGREALPEGVVVLEGEHRGRRQHRDLAIVVDRFERRAHRDFRLAVTHIAAEQAVHGRGRLHVALDVNNRVHLIFGFVELEGVFELALPFAVGGKRMSLGGLAHGVEFQQLLGHVLHGLLHARLGLLPLLRAQPIQYRLHPFGGAVLLHQVQPGEWDIQARTLGVLQDHEFGGSTVFLRNLLQTLVLADAMLDMHHVIADGEIAKVGEEGRDFRLLPLRMGQRNFRLIEQIARPEEDKVRLRQGDSFGHIRLHDGCGFYVFREVRGLVHVHFAARLGGAAADAERQVVFVEDVGQALDFAGARDSKEDSLAFAHETVQLLRSWQRQSRESALWAGFAV